MITDSYSTMIELGLERDLSLYRSGSAPPTVEGSLSAVSGLPEEELRSDPAYISYYYSNINLNPRLPPPLLSKEDWRFSQRLNGPGVDPLGPEGSSKIETRSLFSSEFGDKSEQNGKWGGDGLIGLPGLGLGSKQKSFAEIVQDDITRGTPAAGYPSRPASRNAFENNIENSESQFSHNIQNMTIKKSTPQASQTYASALGASLSRSTTPEPPLARAPSPRILPVGEGRPRNVSKTEPADLAAAFSSMTLFTNEIIPNMIDDTFNNHLKQQPFQHHMHSSPNSYLKGNSSSAYQKVESPNSPFSNYGYGGCAPSPTSPSIMGNQAVNLPPLFQNLVAASALGVTPMSPMGSRAIGGDMSLIDPLYLQYIRANETVMDNNANSYMDLLGIQNAYLGQMLLPQKSQYCLPYLNKSASMNHHNYYGNSLGVDMVYPGSPLGGSLLPGSPFGAGSPVRSVHFPSGFRNFGTGRMGSWQNMDGHFASSLLDEFKSNKTKCFELSEITGHVVEFSADQYGSRFIQQKLETATLEEKNMVFHEINPRALSLVTDVFGNYVIQKFFEHGTPAQIRELADHLTEHVLTLSLQMYGCRVIQKAIEVVDLDQQTKMVVELDGHIMRCVRDQNGNHVIQKCIECVPEEVIHFIISVFYDQVVTLSTHPYGCRVIQRVLEHCSNPKTLQIVMDEIMQSVCMLAQDQYGNYVVQHVLEHGQPHERSDIINKLIGQIVQMSQQKFASNVVEKCLSFGTPTERQILVDQMLSSTDENDPLQVMMKDQFANYVVQKVLETCDDQQLELILNRIKVHLNALKKYTYGKHIVARVEKLVAAGERRISIMASSYST